MVLIYLFLCSFMCSIYLYIYKRKYKKKSTYEENARYIKLILLIYFLTKNI